MNIYLEPVKKIITFIPILIFFLAFGGIIIFISRFSGWAKLAEKYKTTSDFIGDKKRFQYGKIGRLRYKNCLTVGINSEGVYLALSFPFNIGSPPLIIPWRVITEIKEEKFFIIKTANFSLNEFPNIPIRIPWKFIENNQYIPQNKIIK